MRSDGARWRAPLSHDARAIRGVDDSKVLSPAQRARLAAIICERALAVSIGAASVREIDRFNIYHASVLAIRRAIARLCVQPDHVLIDGLPIRSLGLPHVAVVGGDRKCFNVACASIVAKVTRDRLMVSLSRRHDGYSWESNVGYATRRHIDGLLARGITPHHRRSFMWVQRVAAGQLTLGFFDEVMEGARDVDAVEAEIIPDDRGEPGAPGEHAPLLADVRGALYRDGSELR
jgi:ribonuclease HII